jgi:hypothetical protein
MFAAYDFAPWAGLVFVLTSLIISDFLFLESGAFVFDPIFDNWQRRNAQNRS